MTTDTKAVSEFGHSYHCSTIVCWDAWGAGPFEIEANGKRFRFEDSDRFGPSLVNKNGDIAANPWPGPRSPFWRAHRCWMKQGRRLDDDGITCVWDEPAPTVIRKIGRKLALVVTFGDDDGDHVIEQPKERS